MSKILITGANGQLGTELRHLLDERGIAYDARDAKDMDITDRQAVEEQVTALKPAVIYHCAAYTAVDKAEDEGKTIITREYPADWKRGDEPYYPVNNQRNNGLYQQYTELAGQKAPNVIFGGRLGQYKYYNMDQVIKAALTTVAEEFDWG